jgi:hypothetical protein
MASLNDPINVTDIIARYQDFVTAAADNQLPIWGTDAVPFSQMPTSYFAGTTTQPVNLIELDSADLVPSPDIIDGSDVHNALLTETNKYTNIRQMRAILNVTGGGGNRGSYSSPGVIYDQTRLAYMSSSYRQSLSSVAGSNVIATGYIISRSDLETYMQGLENAFLAARNNVQTVTINICHSSCHSSCHGSRGRR